jgi:hypothetical protein
MRRLLLVPFSLLVLTGSATAQITVSVDKFAAYLHLDPVDLANAAQAIDLGAMGLVPGTTITLAPAGDWDAGPGGDTQTNMLGVFSAGAGLLAETAAHRVPGAIDAGVHDVTGGTWPNGQPTDIPEDFLISGPPRSSLTVVIPPGATHLFVTPADIYYRDNEDPDGDFAVTITVVSTAGVGGSPPGTPHAIALRAEPNPFRDGTSIGFQLDQPATVRLTIHDVTGRRVRTLIASRLPAGRHAAMWDGRDASGLASPSGSYFARLEVARRTGVARISRVR